MQVLGRRLWLAIIGFLLGGLTLTGFGVWELLAAPDWGLSGGLYWRGTLGALVSGVVFTSVATEELVHRVRKGPQQPGRHTRL